MKVESILERKLVRARVQLLLNQPFFGSLCLRLKLLPGAVPTMATDGRQILYDPGFVDALRPAELEAVLAHEVLHCALGHHCRRGQRDTQLWNQAADLAINPILIRNGFTLPAGALVDPAFNNLSAEEIYVRLLQKTSNDPKMPAIQQPQRSGPGSAANGGQQEMQNTSSGAPNETAEKEGKDPEQTQKRATSPRPGGFGEVLDATDDWGNPVSQAEKSHQQQEWSIAAEQAMRSAKACGHRAANLERPVNESRQSKQDWRTILRDFIAARIPSGYLWSPPNRRYIASGLYLPSVERSGLGPIVVAIDTSGSIGNEELEQFAGEISAICDETKPESIHVVYCDAAVQAWQEFQPSEPLHLEPRGGGGTDFRPVFEWVELQHIEPVCLIYLTDLCCYSYPEAPDYPVLWVTSSRNTAPFGETIQITLE